MAVLLFLLGLAGLLVAVFAAVIRAIFKRGWNYKRCAVIAGASLLALVVGIATLPPAAKQEFNQGYEAGWQAAGQKEEQQAQKEERKQESKETVEQKQKQPSGPEQPTSVALEKKPAKDAEELAQIIEEVIKASGNVERCFIGGAEEEVSTGGYWLYAEVNAKDAKDAWQIARNAVLAAYLNKGQVPLVKVSVNVILPPPSNEKFYPPIALQVAAGKNHFDRETLEFLRKGTWMDFREWVKENRTKPGYKRYADELWADGPLS